jgi:hypothetical protein
LVKMNERLGAAALGLLLVSCTKPPPAPPESTSAPPPSAAASASAQPRPASPGPTGIKLVEEKVSLTEVATTFERTPLDKEAPLDVVWFGEPRRAFMDALVKSAPGLKFGVRVERSPSGLMLLFGEDAQHQWHAVAMTPDGKNKGSWQVDDAIFRGDAEVLVRRGGRLDVETIGGGTKQVVVTNVCDEPACDRYPRLLFANADDVAVALNSKGFIVSEIAAIAFADGKVRKIPGFSGSNLGLAVRRDGTVCSMQIPTADGRIPAGLVCAKPPWNGAELHLLPAAGGDPQLIGAEIFSGSVGRVELTDVDKKTLRVLDTSKYKGLPTALPAAGMVVIDTDGGFALIDVAAKTAHFGTAPGCHNVIAVTGSKTGAFIASCEKGSDYQPTLFRFKR